MIRYRPEIDGLRAVAVLGVIFYHIGWSWAKGGWLGVDVFFVISGYLISSILLKEMRETGAISLSNFYQRRVRRIMPALFVCLIGSFPIAYQFVNSYYFHEYLQSFGSAVFSVSNIFFWQHSGYFAVDDRFVPLLHTWTLGVEEQFYLIIPSLFALLATRAPKGRRRIWLGIFALTIVSFLLCRYGRGLLSTEFRFYMLPTRMWELAIGSFVALLLANKPGLLSVKRPFINIFGLSCVIFFLFAFHSYDGNSYFAEKSLFVCLATAVFIVTANEWTVMGRLFAWQPIRFIGIISYSMYLWHWPLIILRNTTAFRYSIENTFWLDSGVIILCLFLAYLSWKYVEMPFRRKQTWRSCLRPLAPIALGVAACAMIGGLAYSGNSLILDRSIYLEPGYSEQQKGHFPILGPSAGKPLFMLIGDSHARADAYAYDDLAIEYGITGLLATRSSTTALPNIRPQKLLDQPPYARLWLDYLEKHHIKHVVLSGKWDSYYEPEYFRDLKSGRRLTTEIIASELRALVERLLRQGHTVWVSDQVPHLRRDPIFGVALWGKEYSESYENRSDIHFAAKALASFNSPRLHIIDAGPYLLKKNKLRPVSDNTFLYRDTHHLTPAGARLIEDAFRPIFEQIARERKNGDDSPAQKE